MDAIGVIGDYHKTLGTLGDAEVLNVDYNDHSTERWYDSSIIVELHIKEIGDISVTMTDSHIRYFKIVKLNKSIENEFKEYIKQQVMEQTKKFFENSVDFNKDIGGDLVLNIRATSVYYFVLSKLGIDVDNRFNSMPELVQLYTALHAEAQYNRFKTIVETCEKFRRVISEIYSYKGGVRKEITCGSSQNYIINMYSNGWSFKIEYDYISDDFSYEVSQKSSGEAISGFASSYDEFAAKFKNDLTDFINEIDSGAFKEFLTNVQYRF